MAHYLGYIGHIQYLQDLNDVDRLPLSKVYKNREDPFTLYNDRQFRQRYRFDKASVEWLAKLLEPDLPAPDGRGCGLTSEKQVLIALRFYGTGSFHRETGDLLKVSESTACRVVKRVSLALANKREDFISMPTPEDEGDIAEMYRQISGGRLPGCVGAIDCTHIMVLLPARRDMGRYYNRKGYYSLNVQAIGDPKLKIRNIVCRWPGSVHDSRIYSNSVIGRRFQGRAEPGHLLGDGGYAATRHMLIPIRKPATPAEISYNEAQIKARNSVERLFGVWKSRFPCLGGKMRLHISTTQAVIIACAVLHNIVIDLKDPEFAPVGVLPRARVRGLPPLPDDEVGVAYKNSIVEGHFS